MTGQCVPWNFAQILEIKFMFCCYAHCNFYVKDTKRNALFINLMKTFTESHRVSDSFENVSFKIRFIHYEHMKADHRYSLSMEWLK